MGALMHADAKERLITLAREFMATPIGKHSVDLERLLLKFRSGPIAGRLVVICLTPHKEWLLGRLSGRRGDPIDLVDKTIFHSIDDANRQVFGLRWRETFGEDLEL